MILSFLARFADLMLTNMSKQSNVTYENTGFTLNVITSTILTANTFKVQMILGFVLPVALLSFHLHHSIIIAFYQPSPVIELIKTTQTR